MAVLRFSSQEITVVTNPPGASCVFEREGLPVGTVANTPGTALIRKSKYDITVKCTKPGYEEAQYLNNSGTSAYIAGNIAADLILTLGVSSIVDSASGADNKYDSIVNISLVPAQQTAASTSPAQKPSLGVVGRTVGPGETGPAADLPEAYGAFVDGVAPRSPAAQGGIKQSDIIRTFNGHRVSTLDELDAYAAETTPGSKVKLGVFRDREMIDVDIDL